jgi:hypothetical protein
LIFTYVESVIYNQYDSLDPNDSGDVCNRRGESALDALLDEIVRIEVMHQSLHDEKESVPQRHDIDRRPMQRVRLLIEFQISAYAQIVMRLLQDVIYHLKGAKPTRNENRNSNKKQRLTRVKNQKPACKYSIMK